MNCRANNDLFLLHDEKFDFDVSLSPASSNGDEDEVFLGPVRHKERCVSVNLESQIEGVGLRTSWSPLTGDQLEAVCQEAHRLADQLQNGELSQLRSKEEDMPSKTPTDREEFIQDDEAKLNVFGQTTRMLSPIKRETFCVQDSPMKQLPPAIQNRLLRGSSTNTASSTRPATAYTQHASANKNSLAYPATSTRLSTSSPVVRAKSQPRTGLRGKAPLGVVLPSKPAAPTTSCSATKSRVEKVRLQAPSKLVGSLKRSPASHPSSRAESSEDLLSDSASVASDISDSSINSSLLGKRSLAPPTKGVVKKLPVVKATRLHSRRVIDRKNTSSSSSSVSSFNSSTSLSPAKGKLNSSLNRSLSNSTGPAPSSINRPVNPSRTRRSTVNTTVESVSSTTGRRSMSTQAKKSTPIKRAEVTPTKRIFEKSAIATSASAKPQSVPKTKSKPEALVAPTPTGGVRGPAHVDSNSKVLKPKWLMSVSSMDSLPQKPAAGPLTPPVGGCKVLQAKARRPSALPTPVRRRVSTIPVATPTNPTRPSKPPPTSDSDPAPGSHIDTRERNCSLISTDTQEVDPDVPSIQPFCLEVEEPSVFPSSSLPQSNHSESAEPAALCESKSEPGNLIELQSTEESKDKTQEVLLLDLPAPTLQPQEKLLIDLTNTPDLVRTSNKSCTTTQLIDLSSPLIKWSPEDKSENNAPLINLSF